MNEETQIPTFKEKWEEQRLLKRTKKKARKELQNKGFTHTEATGLVKQAMKRIASNKPERRASNRGG